MPQCSAPNCKNRGAHLFPKDPIRKKLWENALKIKNFRASNTSRLCRLHFKADDYFGRSRYTDAEPTANFLKKSVVPSIFSFTKIEQKPEELQYEKLCTLRRKLLQDLTEHGTATEHRTVTEPTVSTPRVRRGEETCTTKEVEVLDRSTHTEPLHSKSTRVDHEDVYPTDRYKDDDIDDITILFYYIGFENDKKFHFVCTLSPRGPLGCRGSGRRRRHKTQTGPEKYQSIIPVITEPI